MAKWKRRDDFDENVYECSDCGKILVLAVGTPQDSGYSICPDCGAKMEECG